MLKRDSFFAIAEFQFLRKAIINHHDSGALRPTAIGR